MEEEAKMETNEKNIIIYIEDTGAVEAIALARSLAERISAPVTCDPAEAGAAALVLHAGQDGLWLTEGLSDKTSAWGPAVRGDFSDMRRRLAPHALNRELLVRAAKIKGVESPLVIDATAGMGEDSLLLAAAGCRVVLYERDAVIEILLADALRRAGSDPALAETISRMQLVAGDSIAALRIPQETPPDVVYLDPMFPERTKSGLVKKKFQLLHRLEAPADDEEALLAAAIAARPQRIVIKRPLKGPYLAGRKPSYTLSGKKIRYDCIALPR